MLYNNLQKYAAGGTLRMHMPGHKGNPSAAPWLNTNTPLDITEINGFDNLYSPDGILKNSMDEAARLWHSKKSFYLVNGSTGGILAGIRTLTKREDSIICARNCHASVLHAIELCGLRANFIMPDYIDKYGICASVSPAKIREAIDRFPDASLIIITSPTYEGIISDIESVCKYAHQKGIAVLIDEAHGAHLGMSDMFTGGSIKGKADIVVQSLHKTLSCPTQCAILHVCESNVDIERLSHQLSVFQTSSPSYLFLSAMDSFIHSNIKEAFIRWENAIKKFYEILDISKLEFSGCFLPKCKNVFDFDKSKIYISALKCSADGFKLSEILRNTYNIEIEMSGNCGITAMTGVGDTEASLTRLALALNSIDRTLSYQSKNAVVPPLSKANSIISIESALEKKHSVIKAEKAIGKICGEYIWTYPPGIPIIVPGEEITAETVAYLSKPQSFKIHSTFKHMQNEIAVL